MASQIPLNSPFLHMFSHKSRLQNNEFTAKPSGFNSPEFGILSKLLIFFIEFFTINCFQRQEFGQNLKKNL